MNERLKQSWVACALLISCTLIGCSGPKQDDGIAKAQSALIQGRPPVPIDVLGLTILVPRFVSPEPPVPPQPPMGGMIGPVQPPTGGMMQPPTGGVAGPVPQPAGMMGTAGLSPPPNCSPGARCTETFTVDFPSANVEFSLFAFLAGQEPTGGFFSPGPPSRIPPSSRTKIISFSGNTGDTVVIGSSITSQRLMARLDGVPDRVAFSCSGSLTIRLEMTCIQCFNTGGAGACEACTGSGLGCVTTARASRGSCNSNSLFFNQAFCNCGRPRQVSDTLSGSVRIQNSVCE